MADETDELAPSKRRTRSKPSQGNRPHGPDIVLRLLNADTAKLGLSHPRIIEFEKLEHLTFNCDKVEYLYVVCAAIFDVENSMLTLTHVPSVECLDGTDDVMIEWPLSEDDDLISYGTYCLIFDERVGNCNVILVVSLF